MGIANRVREYFLLTEARATAARVPDQAREELGRTLSLCRQRAEAADALYSNGHTAEGLRLARDGFDLLVEALPALDGAVGAGQPSAAPGAMAPVEGEAREEAADAEAADASDSETPESADETAADEETSEPEPGEQDEAEAERSDTKSDEAAEAASSEDRESPAEEGPAAEHSPEAEPRASDEEAVEAKEEANAGEEPAWTSILRRRGLAEAKVQAVRQVRDHLARGPLPDLDEEVSPAHAELFQEVVAARRHLDRVFLPAALTPRQLGVTRVGRLSVAGLLVVAIIFGVGYALRTPHEVTAIASATFSAAADTQPDQIIDGDPESNWLLPDGTSGWVEVRMSPPRDIRVLKLLNSHNHHWNDRATKEYTVELYAEGELLRSIDAEWPEFSETPEWTEHEVNLTGVTRVRFIVRSWHRQGGGLAELDWE